MIEDRAGHSDVISDVAGVGNLLIPNSYTKVKGMKLRSGSLLCKHIIIT